MDDCAGLGRCHGCVKWCDCCGDVTTMCDADRCDQHRCMGCNILLCKIEQDMRRDWLETCSGCKLQEQIEDAEREMLRWAAAGYEDRVALCASEIERLKTYPTPG